MNDLLSPKQVARAIGLSESSIKRYCDQGAIHFVRTLGGHRKLPLSDVLRFVKEREHVIVVPGALGLPTRSQRSEIGLERGVRILVDALIKGNEESVWQVVYDLYLARHSISTICDRLMIPAFREIRERWASSSIEVYQERRSCEFLQRVLFNLRSTLKAPDKEWDACGGTLEDDTNSLPNAMAELVLRDCLWNATSLGTSIPFDSMVNALSDMKPRLFWLTATRISDIDRFVKQVESLSQIAEANGVAFLVGGRAVDEDLRRRLAGLSCQVCESLQQLENLARSMRRAGATNAGLETES
ncbi:MULTISPECIES: B12-binding domain-containing protein [unclassified Schlesneria]|uniref:MerR family transcriptional regulator n=1 Tax=Schlesneria TaxID=656899 RepID=UPI002EF7C1E0